MCFRQTTWGLLSFVAATSVFWSHFWFDDITKGLHSLLSIKNMSNRVCNETRIEHDWQNKKSD